MTNQRIRHAFCVHSLWIVAALLMGGCLPSSVQAETETDQTADVTLTPTPMAKSVFPSARLAKNEAKSSLDAESILLKHGFHSAPPVCQADFVSHAIPVAIRLGAALSPRLKFAGGADVTIPGLSIARGFSTRVDIDAIVAANFGGITTLVPLTFDQVYRVRLPGGGGIYVGGGIGPYFGEVTRFGGKLFIGGEITPRVGLEGTVHFQGYGDAIATVQARFPF